MAITFHPNGKIDGINNTNFDSSLSAGHVVQTVHNPRAHTQMANVTSSSDTDTGLFCEITPRFADSKILVLYSTHVYLYGGGADIGCCITLRRKIGSGSYSIMEAGIDTAAQQNFYINATSTEYAQKYNDQFYDTPGTNSEVVRYAVYGSVHSGGTASFTRLYTNHYITCLEIKQ